MWRTTFAVFTLKDVAALNFEVMSITPQVIYVEFHGLIYRYVSLRVIEKKQAVELFNIRTGKAITMPSAIACRLCQVQYFNASQIQLL